LELRPARTAALAVALACGLLAVVEAPAFAQEAETRSQAVRPGATLTRPSSPTRPPRDHFLNAVQAARIAARPPKLREELRKYDRVRRETFAKGPGRWQVSWYADGNEVAQVIVDEREGRAIEVWTGPQVAWQMARGIDGAFGRKINAPQIWIPLMLVFFIPFFDPRRPLRLVHLDLLVLLSFSISHIYFNRGEIFTSVPLVYPVLAYLLVRMLMLARSHRVPRRGPPFLLVPATWLVLGLIFLIGFRVGLNVTNSNVIDVGYSGVIGADRIADGSDLYGDFPDDNRSGDTYGPLNYYAYVPFEQLFPWSGSWDDLPAAHAAALAFDLLTMLGLFLAGRMLRRGREGNTLGLVFAYGWAAYPYTLFVLNSNANDSLIALLVTAAFLLLAHPRVRGVVLALAASAKFAPLALAALWASYDRRRSREAIAFALAFGATLVLAFALVIPDGGVRELWDRTVGFQLGRDSPFSIWGQEDGLGWLQDLVKAGAVLLAVAVYFAPKEKNALQVAALGAAVLIAVQLGLSHWFYLYIVWWFPLALIALLGASGPSRNVRQETARLRGRQARTQGARVLGE
jgi:glycosyl transferase family 87